MCAQTTRTIRVASNTFPTLNQHPTREAPATMRIASKRLGKELNDLRSGGLPEGCKIVQAEDLQTWVIEIQALGETLFTGERFALRFRFTDSYPLESPEVVFLTTDGWSAPELNHVYSNGHLCLSILGVSMAHFIV